MEEFTIFKCNTINLEKLSNELIFIIHAEDTENYEKVMTCITTIPSTSTHNKELGGK